MSIRSTLRWIGHGYSIVTENGCKNANGFRHQNKSNKEGGEGLIDMPNRRVELTVCNPRGGPEATPMDSPSPRLRNLDGKKIGILMFSLWGLAETLLPQLKDALKKQVHGDRVS